MKQLPNIISILRIPLSAAMFAVPPFSALFWIFYLGSGLPDILDGFLARTLHQESALSAKLDSLADFAFAGCLTISAVINMKIPRVHGAAYMGKQIDSYIDLCRTDSLLPVRVTGLQRAFSVLPPSFQPARN